MTLHLRPIPSRPIRIDVRTDRKKRKAIHSELRKSLGKVKRRPQYGVTYSQS